MNRAGSEGVFYDLQVFLIKRKYYVPPVCALNRWRVSFISVQPSKEIWMPRINLQTSAQVLQDNSHVGLHACKQQGNRDTLSGHIAS